MKFGKKLLVSMGVVCLGAFSSSASAGDWGFSFGIGTGERYYRSCYPTRTYVYYDSSPSYYYSSPLRYYDYAPQVVVYDRAPRRVYRSCSPRRTVVYRDCSPRRVHRSTRTCYRSSRSRSYHRSYRASPTRSYRASPTRSYYRGSCYRPSRSNYRTSHRYYSPSRSHRYYDRSPRVRIRVRR
ncbi:MAG: hypothetical protein KAY37_17705 [Phycisphaerae bacterium]|nr:hypothetical protein [Phycisphaerae bacterium]